MIPGRETYAVGDHPAAPAGVEAAHRAGMCAIGVRSSQDTLEADRVVQRLDELPDDVFDQLLNA